MWRNMISTCTDNHGVNAKITEYINRNLESSHSDRPRIFRVPCSSHTAQLMNTNGFTEMIDDFFQSPVMVYGGQCILLLRSNWKLFRLSLGFAERYSEEWENAAGNLLDLEDLVEDFLSAVHSEKLLSVKPTEAAKMRWLSINKMLSFLVQHEDGIKKVIQSNHRGCGDKFTKAMKYWMEVDDLPLYRLQARIMADFYKVFNHLMVNLHFNNGYIAENMYFIVKEFEDEILKYENDPSLLEDSYLFAEHNSMSDEHHDYVVKYCGGILSTITTHFSCWMTDEAMRWAVLANLEHEDTVRELVESWYEEYETTTDPIVKEFLDPYGFFDEEFNDEYEDFVNGERSFLELHQWRERWVVVFGNCCVINDLCEAAFNIMKRLDSNNDDDMLNAYVRCKLNKTQVDEDDDDVQKQFTQFKAQIRKEADEERARKKRRSNSDEPTIIDETEKIMLMNSLNTAHAAQQEQQRNKRLYAEQKDERYQIAIRVIIDIIQKQESAIINPPVILLSGYREDWRGLLRGTQHPAHFVTVEVLRSVIMYCRTLPENERPDALPARTPTSVSKLLELFTPTRFSRIHREQVRGKLPIVAPQFKHLLEMDNSQAPQPDSQETNDSL